MRYSPTLVEHFLNPRNAGFMRDPDGTGEDEYEGCGDVARFFVRVRDGRAVGIISQTDLVNASFIQPYLRYWGGMTARHLMTAPVITVAADAPLGQALVRLEAHRIHRLVVTEPTDGGERPVGILSLTDVARALAEAGPAPTESAP
jgi:CBS domain-containing protein